MEMTHNSLIKAGKKIGRALLFDALKCRASDIHLEPDFWGMKVRYRIDGTMQDIMDLPGEYQPAVITSLKEEAHMDLLLTEVPQEGKIRLSSGNDEHLFITSVLPVIYGERIVMHLVRHQYLDMNLQDLGFSPSQAAHAGKALDCPSGLFIICGSLGNGRSTTALNILRNLRQQGRNCVSLEDSPTYEVKGLTQIPLTMDDLGGRLQESLNNLNPDTVLVDEVLNSLSLDLVRHMLRQGRLVIAVTRARKASSAIMDLISMGMPGPEIASMLQGVLEQKLVKMLCPRCRKPHAPPDSSGGGFFRSSGCEECRMSGHSGRMLLSQLIIPDPGLKSFLCGTGPAGPAMWSFCSDPEDMPLHVRSLAEEGAFSFDEMKRIIEM